MGDAPEGAGWLFYLMVLVWFDVIANQCFNNTLTELGLSTVFLTVEKKVFLVELEHPEFKLQIAEKLK